MPTDPRLIQLLTAAAARAADAAAINAAVTVRIRRLPGERFVASDEDEPCFHAQVADEAGTSRAWLLEYE